MKRLPLTLGLALLLVCSAAAQQRTKDRTDDRARDKDEFSNVSDQDFVARVAMGNMAEVQFGKLALNQTNNAGLRKFAQRLIDDHSKANQELAKIASTKGIALPRQLDKEHREAATKLARMRGPEFDRAFAADMVDDHKKDIALFEHEVKNGKDKDIQAWAEKTLPTLKEHLKMAQELAGEKGDKIDKRRER
jgi:putative membrane protein